MFLIIFLPLLNCLKKNSTYLITYGEQIEISFDDFKQEIPNIIQEGRKDCFKYKYVKQGDLNHELIHEWGPYKKFVNLPTIYDSSLIVALSEERLLFMNYSFANNVSIDYSLELYADPLLAADCLDISPFFYNNMTGIIGLFLDQKGAFSIFFMYCDKDGYCQNIELIKNLTFNNSYCMDPKLTSFSFTWIAVYCKGENKTKIDIIWTSEDNETLEFGELTNFVNITTQVIQKVSFYDKSTLAILDLYEGVQFIGLTLNLSISNDHETIRTLECKLLRILRLQVRQTEKYLDYAFQEHQLFTQRQPRGLDLKEIMHSMVIITNQTFYEVVLPDEPEDLIGYQFPVNDKFNLQRFSIFEEGFETSQLIFDNYYYYLCLSGNKTECNRLDRHVQFQSYNFYNGSIKPFMIAANDQFAVSCLDATKILLFLGNKQIQLIQNTRNTLQIISNTSTDCVGNFSLETDELSFNIDIINTDLEDNKVFKLQSELGNLSFANTDGEIPIEQFVKGPAIQVQLDMSSNRSQAIDCNFYQAIRFVPIGEDFNNSMNKSIFYKSFLDTKFILNLIQDDSYGIFLQFIYDDKRMPDQPEYAQFISAYSLKVMKPIRQVIMTGQHLVIQFLEDIPIFLQMNLVQSNLTDGYYYFVVEDEPFTLPFPNIVECKIFNSNNFENLFINVYFADNSSALIIKSLKVTEEVTYINISHQYRKLDVMFLASGLIIASRDDKLYTLKLVKNETGRNFNTTYNRLPLSQALSTSFVFMIADKKLFDQKIPRLIICDSFNGSSFIVQYYLKNIRRLAYIQQISYLPLYQKVLTYPILVSLSQTFLLVKVTNASVPDDHLFIYDLQRTGTDTLQNMFRSQDVGELDPFYTVQNQNPTYFYCLNNRSRDLKQFFFVCFHRKVLEISLREIDDNTQQSFKVQGISFSRVNSTLNKISIDITISGQFYFQETAIVQRPEIQTLTHWNVTEQEQYDQIMIDPSNYFSGPVTGYNISGYNSSLFELNTYINQPEIQNISVDYQFEDYSMNSQYLIAVSQSNITLVDFTNPKCSSIFLMDYVEFNEILKYNQQKPITVCSRAFLIELSEHYTDNGQLIILICQRQMLNESVESQPQLKNYMLAFVVLRNGFNVEFGFRNFTLFPHFISNNQYFQNGEDVGNITDVQMLNYALNSTTFFVITVLASQNFRYSAYDETQPDYIYTLLLGFINYDKQGSKTRQVTLMRLKEFNAYDYQKDKLVVQNLQIMCESIDQDSPLPKSGNLTTLIYFNDEQNCTLYRSKITFYYDIDQLNKSSIQNFTWGSLNLKSAVINQSNQFQLNYINTFVYYKNHSCFVEVTTNSVSFDIKVDEDLNILEFENIFRQYTDCPNPEGSLHYTSGQYLAMSCKNASNQTFERRTFVKIFSRQNKNGSNNLQIEEVPGRSMIQAVPIDGELLYMDLTKDTSNKFTLSILTQFMKKEQVLGLALSKYQINENITLKLRQDANDSDLYMTNFCAYNLNLNHGQECVELKLQILEAPEFEQDLVNFLFLVIIPLLICIMTLIFGILLYKRDKNKRVQEFEQYLYNRIKINDSSLPLTIKKTNSILDSIY